jgi:tetratricopeptide (TPR) repeat protein
MHPCATFLAVTAFLAPAQVPGPNSLELLVRGRAEMARGEYLDALRTFVAIHPTDDTPLDEVRREGIVAAYTHVGGPDRALLFFRRVAGDHAPVMLERLAVQYEKWGRFAYSSRVYQQLLALAPMSPRVCSWQVNVVQNTLSAGTKPEQILEIQQLVLVDHQLADRPADRKRECHRALHDILFEAAKVWTLEMTQGCTAYSWHHWPQLETLLQETLAAFPDDPRASEVRTYLDHLHNLQSRSGIQPRPFVPIWARRGDER